MTKHVRLESGQMPLVRQPVALALTVTDILQDQLVLAADKQLHLVNDVPLDLPTIPADPALLGRVIQNLVGNAIKFTPPDGTIRVHVAHSDTAPDTVAVSISDTGPGIPVEIHDRLFQKFVTGQQRGHGTGLGLAFCKLVVEAHGGAISATSRTGQGTTFTFTLPLTA